MRIKIAVLGKEADRNPRAIRGYSHAHLEAQLVDTSDHPIAVRHRMMAYISSGKIRQRIRDYAVSAGAMTFSLGQLGKSGWGLRRLYRSTCVRVVARASPASVHERADLASIELPVVLWGNELLGWGAILGVVVLYAYVLAVVPFLPELGNEASPTLTTATLAVLGSPILPVASGWIRRRSLKVVQIPLFAVVLLAFSILALGMVRAHAVVYVNRTPQVLILPDGRPIAPGESLFERFVSVAGLMPQNSLARADRSVEGPAGGAEDGSAINASCDPDKSYAKCTKDFCDSPGKKCIYLTHATKLPWQAEIGLVMMKQIGCTWVPDLPNVGLEVWKKAGRCAANSLSIEANASEALPGVKPNAADRASVTWRNKEKPHVDRYRYQKFFPSGRSNLQRLGLVLRGNSDVHEVQIDSVPLETDLLMPAERAGDPVDATVMAGSRQVGTLAFQLSKNDRCDIISSGERLSSILFRGKPEGEHTLLFTALLPEFVSAIPLCWPAGHPPEIAELHLDKYWVPSSRWTLQLPPHMMPASMRIFGPDGSSWGELACIANTMQDGAVWEIGPIAVDHMRPELRRLTAVSVPGESFAQWHNRSGSFAVSWFWGCWPSVGDHGYRPTEWRSSDNWKVTCSAENEECTTGAHIPCVYNLDMSPGSADCVRVKNGKLREAFYKKFVKRSCDPQKFVLCESPRASATDTKK
jgi:hypothetical protein